MSLHIRGNIATIGDVAGNSLAALRSTLVRREAKRERDRTRAKARRIEAATIKRLSVPLSTGLVMRPIRPAVAH